MAWVSPVGRSWLAGVEFNSTLGATKLQQLGKAMGPQVSWRSAASARPVFCLQSVGALGVVGTALEDLRGLDSLNTMNGSLVVLYNPILTSLTGLGPSGAPARCVWGHRAVLSMELGGCFPPSMGTPL